MIYHYNDCAYFNRRVTIHEDDKCNSSASGTKCLRVVMKNIDCRYNQDDNRPFIMPQWLAFAWSNTPVRKNFAGKALDM